jgi:hypothetical protein
MENPTVGRPDPRRLQPAQCDVYVDATDASIEPVRNPQ